MPTPIVPDRGVEYAADTLPPQHWDIVLTCFEPLVQVTGGIGTYHRLLIDALAQAGKRVLVLTHAVNSTLEPPAGVSVFRVDSFAPTKPYNFVGLAHEQFSLHCHFALKHLFDHGHRFGLVEFSDYGGDGFYPLRARAAGVYDLGIAAVRLHSPNVMLVEDNGGKHSRLSQYERDIIDREMSAYDDCDVILYGGDAMRDRILELAQKFGQDLSAKMVKCPHPYPKFLFEDRPQQTSLDNARKVTFDAILKNNKLANAADLPNARIVGIFGRIEDRKGQYQFLSGLLRNPTFVAYLKRSDVHFLIAGHNVLDHIGHFRLSDLYGLIYRLGLSDRFHFTGKVPQSVLAEFARVVSGYIFPSVFENYPNALLEVLPTTKPIAISARGCMAEITDGFRDVTVFDPLLVSAEAIVTFLGSLPPAGAQTDQAEYHARVAALDARQEKMLAYYRSPEGPAHQAHPDSVPTSASVGFVVPIYQVWRYLDETLASIRKVMRPGDQIVVVDDASDLENFAEIQKICDGHDVELVRLPENGGPGAPRLAGAAHLKTDLIQYCDADDLLDPAGIAFSRQAFANDPDLDMLTGIMSCFQDANHYWVPRNGHVWTAIEAHFAHSGSMYRREKIASALAVKHERLQRNEDWLASLLVLAQGGRARMFPVVTYYYRRFEGTRSTQNIASNGAIQQRIIALAFENWQFLSSAENARLRELLVSFKFSGGDSPTMSPTYFPLRYQLVDALFFRLVRNPLIERATIRLKRMWTSSKGRKSHAQ